jgi:hypothetical protein
MRNEGFGVKTRNQHVYVSDTGREQSVSTAGGVKLELRKGKIE